VQALDQSLDILRRERLEELRLKEHVKLANATPQEKEDRKAQTRHRKCTHGIEIRNCKVIIAATVHLSS